MSTPATAWVGLIRGVNVGGRATVAMAALRTAAMTAGLKEVRTYIQSGNLIFRSGRSQARLEADLEGMMAQEFGFQTPVMVRAAADWQAVLKDNPFPDASTLTPNLVMLAVSRRPPAPGAVAELQARAADGEQVRAGRGGIWIYYRGGSGRSKLSPPALEGAVGSPVTTRNWRTVVKLWELVRE